MIRTRRRGPRIGTMVELQVVYAARLEALPDTLALCRADGPFDHRLKTKFGPDVGKFLRVHVAPVQGEKAKGRKASFAEIYLWHASVGPDFD